jgi:ABC-type antimicrobial peptide transport system permease subunit
VKVNLVLRTREDPALMIKRVEDAIRTIDARQTFTGAFTLDDVLSEAVARPRLLTVLLGLFGAMGLVLGALGIYGVLAYLVTQRTREIGIRVALGADKARVVRLVLRQGLLLVAGGVVVGLAGAFLVSRMLGNLLYGVGTHDPVTFVTVPAALAAIAMLATAFPAWRAARVDPVIALRAE